jgi:hypothetical protein
MDKKQLIEIIRKVVRQEVKKTIKEIFTNKEDVQESFDLKSLVKTKPKKQQPKKQKEVRYTKNKVLNDVLNETKGGIMSGGNPQVKPGFEDYPDVKNKTFDSSNMVEVLGYGDLVGKGNSDHARNVVAADTIAKSGVKLDQVPESTINALTRDYSGLMKRINKDN